MSENQKNMSFCLLQLEEMGEVEEVFKTAQTMEGVVQCDPVRNLYHLVVRMETESAQRAKTIALEKFQNDPEVKRISFATAEKSKIYKKEADAGNGKDKLVSAYVLFEADTKRLPGLLSDLQKLPFVTAYYPTTGDYDLIVEMKAPSFHQLHRSLTGDIRPLEGIQRCWMLDVINIKQL